jgi:hypothetical protein
MPINDPSPKFEKAFKTFEKDVDTKKIKSFNQLFYQFMIWGKGHTPMTPKQTNALKFQAYKRNKWNVEISRTKRGTTIYRNVGTGRFIKKEDRPVL